MTTASREELLRRRALPLAEFAAEVVRGANKAGKVPMSERLRLYGSTLVPIPVPLARGETEAMYDATYNKLRAGRVLPPVSELEEAKRERTVRYAYAVDLARAFLAKARGVPPARPPADATDELEDGEEVEDDDFLYGAREESREELINATQGKPNAIQEETEPTQTQLNATQVVSLVEYRANVEAGKYTALDALTVNEKLRRFDSPVVPIPVPLAPGETLRQYEDRFLTWLVREKRVTIGALRNDEVRTLERSMRMEFASLNGSGSQRFIPPHTPPIKRTTTTTAQSPLKKLKTEKKSENIKKEASTDQAATPVSTRCKSQSSVASCASCQCEKCLRSGMQILSERITACEAKPSCDCQSGVTDLTHERSPNEEGDRLDSRNEDAIAHQLQQAYDDVNDGILENEKVLKIEETRLETQLDGIAFRERIRLQRENEEMRGLIEGELFPARTAAVCVLIAYLWRHETKSLIQMLEDPTASNLPQVQQRIHERLAPLMKESEYKQEDSTTPFPGGNQSEHKQGPNKDPVPRLDQQRRQELALLVHFDESVRRGVRSILDAAHVPPKSDPEATLP